MAREANMEQLDEETQRKKLKDEKKQLKKDQKEQKKEAKKRADEIARQEDELDNDTGGGFMTFVATVFIVLLWLAVICVVIKLDIGGFGSSIATPLFKNIPVVNRILPNPPGEESDEEGEQSPYGGYESLEEAVAQIRLLEAQLEAAQLSLNARNEEVQNLKAEVSRLSEFEKKQIDFERISKEFYEKVVYADNGPGIEEYKKWYEQMDKTTADYLYKQVVTQLEETKEVQNYVNTYANMKPKQAAAAFEKMTDNLNLVARILKAMDVESRAKIMDALDSDVAARLTKIMEP